MLELNQIHISYDNKECIRNGHFVAYSQQITGIYGESGTGKSSFLYMIGMLCQQQCEYVYKKQILKLDTKQKEEFRNKHISFITQDSTLMDVISVEKNIEFFLSLTSHPKYTVEQLLNKIGMLDKKDAMINQLSGGERQRVAIACALAKNSDIILGDEITSALDENNKEIVIGLLRECAKEGKIVILVSHEKKVIEKCDRVYEIERLELKLKKELPALDNCHFETIPYDNKKTKILEMFELLFHSNRKVNRNRIFVCFIVMCILFMSVSIVLQSFNARGISYHAAGSDVYSTEKVSMKKLLVLNDEYDVFEGYGLIRTLIDFYVYQEDYKKEIENIEHVDTSYEYYTFSYSDITKNGHGQRMELKASRDGKEVQKLIVSEKNKTSVEYDFGFDVIPVYTEENILKDHSVAVSRTLAYMYQLEVGDELELKLNVPFALCRMTDDSTGEKRYIYDNIVEQVIYKAKVTDIIESNSAYNEIYMPYDIMKDLIDKQVNRYKSGEIQVNYRSFAGYSEIIDLSPYAYAVFVDKYENVLSVQNQIQNISDDIFVAYEYQDVLRLNEETKELVRHSFQVAMGSVSVLIIGAMLIELIHMWKYQSIYMIFKMVGYNREKKNKIFLIHGIWQVSIIICSSMFIYMTASIPQFIINAKIADYGQVYQYIPELIYQYTIYGAFSLVHLGIFVVLVCIVVLIVHMYIKIHYDRMDIMTWIRKRNIY